MKKPLIALLLIASQFSHAGEMPAEQSKVVVVEKVESVYRDGGCGSELCSPIFMGTRIWYMCDDGKTEEMYWNFIPMVVSKGDKITLRKGSCSILERLHGHRLSLTK